MSNDTLDTGPPRDRWGRYLLPPPGNPEAKPVPWTRATTIAKAPEDQAGLMKWAQRTVVAGLGRRPDLVALAATTDPTDKTALGRIAGDAEEAGGAATGRNTGTAIHAAIEAANRGEAPSQMFATEVQAYTEALTAAGLVAVPELVERIVVCTDHRIAGTFDMALRDRAGNTFVADLKTGSVAYPAAFSIQLAIYAAADHLVTADYRHYEPAPSWSAERGIIVHLPQGGPCTLHWLDLTAGRHGLDVALAVREWRSTAKANTLLSPVTTVDTPVDTPTDTALDVERLGWFTARYDEVRSAAGPQAIKAAWPAELPTPKHRHTWTPAQLEQACQTITVLHNRRGLDFPPVDPQTAKLRRKPRKTTTEATADEHAATLAAYQALPVDSRRRVTVWQNQGIHVGRPWDAQPTGSTRWAITVNNAAVGIAHHTNDDDIARAWISLVIGEDDAQTFTPGALLGSLTTSEAEQLATLTQLDTFAAAIEAIDTAA